MSFPSRYVMSILLLASVVLLLQKFTAGINVYRPFGRNWHVQSAFRSGSPGYEPCPPIPEQPYVSCAEVKSNCPPGTRCYPPQVRLPEPWYIPSRCRRYSPPILCVVNEEE
ncbi:uncharacterized protein LOC106180998 [Lingula anatina]|uniref:Uncharacterized protein LOC106180998 n=1 Tax=Lingula anatina TaxID=7574 RepID=A0A1S3KEL7_LINAN|nr:uncharacterized protein LOC106180998 [Lingula anatina]|eukprot:XP_013420686.1 uncharacterized protein LOC106180998 [Lingula anatina]